MQISAVLHDSRSGNEGAKSGIGADFVGLGELFLVIILDADAAAINENVVAVVVAV